MLDILYNLKALGFRFRSLILSRALLLHNDLSCAWWIAGASRRMCKFRCGKMAGGPLAISNLYRLNQLCRQIGDLCMFLNAFREVLAVPCRKMLVSTAFFGMTYGFIFLTLNTSLGVWSTVTPQIWFPRVSKLGGLLKVKPVF